MTLLHWVKSVTGAPTPHAPESTTNFMKFQFPTMTNKRKKQFYKKFQWLKVFKKRKQSTNMILKIFKEKKQGYKIVKKIIKGLFPLGCILLPRLITY